MPAFDLQVIESEETPHEVVSLKSKKPVKQVEHKVPEVELSKNIQKFDHKVKVYTKDPYSFNEVAKRITEKRRIEALPTQTASEMLANPTYNTIGKFLGVDTIHGWNKDSDKVYAITEWAKHKSGTQDLSKLMTWIGAKARSVPSFGQARRIDELYLFAKLQLQK